MVQSINQAIVFKHNFCLLIFVSLFAEGHISDMLKFFGVHFDGRCSGTIHQSGHSWRTKLWFAEFCVIIWRKTHQRYFKYCSGSFWSVVQRYHKEIRSQLSSTTLVCCFFSVIIFVLFVAWHTSNSFKGFLNHFDASCKSAINKSCHSC